MKKIILGIMLVMGSLSFSSEKESSVTISNIFDNFKKEETQDQNSSKEESVNLSNIFNDEKMPSTNS